MNNQKAKPLRKAVKRNVNDRYRRLFMSLPDSPVLARLRYAIIIIYKLRYKPYRRRGKWS